MFFKGYKCRVTSIGTYLDDLFPKPTEKNTVIFNNNILNLMFICKHYIKKMKYIINIQVITIIFKTACEAT